jgi:hypothetical protein
MISASTWKTALERPRGVCPAESLDLSKTKSNDVRLKLGCKGGAEHFWLHVIDGWGVSTLLACQAGIRGFVEASCRKVSVT